MNILKLLFDENLSPRLAGLLTDIFPGSTHVDDIGLRGRSDVEIWERARDCAYILLSKDNDFRQLSFLHGAPPKVIWLRIGNAPTQAAAELIRTHMDDITAFAADPETALLVLEAVRERGER